MYRLIYNIHRTYMPTSDVRRSYSEVNATYRLKPREGKIDSSTFSSTQKLNSNFYRSKFSIILGKSIS